MKTVLINVPFRDAYTKEVYVAGKTYPMSEERVKEIKEVNPNFITVVGNVDTGVTVELMAENQTEGQNDQEESQEPPAADQEEKKKKGKQ